MEYRKKPVVIEAITFDEFVRYGIEHGGNIVDGMPWSFEYKGHPVTHENDQCYIIPTLEGDHLFTPDDMLITGVKGEIYPCKIDIFHATYETVETESMSFGQAIEAMKKGKKVARRGWNGKGMFLFLGADIELHTEADLSCVSDLEGDLTLPAIVMKTADDHFCVGWLASQTDMLADDWEIVV